jgi:plastocyanin
MQIQALHPAPAAALHLVTVLAAEKSKVPFYIAGGLLVAWAVIVSVGIGLRRPEFPGNLAGERMVIAITLVLVLAAVSTAVITASPPAKAGTPSSSPAAGSATSLLKLAANPSGQLSYDTKQLSAKAGTVTIEMTNMSPLEHNVTVASGSSVLGATPTFSGGSRKLTLSLKPGTYTFYCSVPGHRQAGMEGTLSVS